MNKIIFKYVDRIYNDVKMINKSEKKKIELIENLSAKVEYLTYEGYKEKDAVSKVIKDFNNMYYINKESRNLKNSKSNIHVIGIIILVVLLFFFLYFYLDSKNTKIDIYNSSVYSDKFQFNLNINYSKDPDLLPVEVEAHLYKDGKFLQKLVVSNSSIRSFEFKDLLSDNEYEIKFFQYIHNDDSSRTKKLIYNTNFKTEPVKKPSIATSDIQATTDSIFYYINASDKITDVNVQLYKDDILKDEIFVGTILTDTKVEFFEILSGTEYEVKIDGEYSLNDGTGKTNTVSKNLTIETKLKELPQVNYFYVESTKNSIIFSIGDIIDNDNVILGFKAELYQNKILMQELNITDYENNEFKDLLANRSYNIKLIAICDFNDGTEEQYAIRLSKIVKTPSVLYPFATILNSSSTSTDITIDLTVTDVHELISDVKAVLYKDGVKVEGKEIELVIGKNSNVTFTDLETSTEYQVKIISSYNLYNGEGVITGQLKTITISTTS